MNLQQIFTILLARKKLIISTFLLTIIIVTAVSLVLPKTYKATATILLNYKGVDPLTGLTLPGQLLPGYMATQIDIITSRNVGLRVVDQLKLDKDPQTIQDFNELDDKPSSIQDWLAAKLGKKLEVVPSRESSVVEINFKGRPCRIRRQGCQCIRPRISKCKYSVAR
jgi:succinoglycan biosynthesis transport protein ExoP